MQKTTAKVEHRDYVPFGWIALRFCHVNFYGFRAEEMKQKWEDIENKRYQKYNSIYKENKIKIQSLRTQVDAIYKQVKESKTFYRFWYNKAEREMLADAQKLSCQADELEEKNEENRGKFFFDTYECRRKIEDLLQQNGFVLTHTSSEDEKCVTKIEVWTLEE